MTEHDSPEELTPAERSLAQHLELLRTEPPTAPGAMVTRIIRAVRWQRALRRPLIAIETFAGALRDGFRLFLAPRQR